MAPVCAAVVVTLIPFGQFGNLVVDWPGRLYHGGAAVPRIVSASIAPLLPLERKCIDDLLETLRSLGVQCAACTTQAHYVSAVRHFILSASDAELKGLLRKRGQGCDRCHQTEEFRKEAFDHVHLPVLTEGGD